MIQLLQFQFNTSDPITADGGVSAGWVLVICFCIIGALVLIILGNINKNNTDAMNTFKEEIKHIHKRIDTREDEHDELAKDHSDLATRVILIEAGHKTHAENIANIIINKMYAANPPTPSKRHPHIPEEES